jgi:hypothetical protein
MPKRKTLAKWLNLLYKIRMQPRQSDPDVTPDRFPASVPQLQGWMIGLFGVVIVLLLLSLLMV